MASKLFTALGRQPKDKALASKLAPTLPRTERVLYTRKLLAFWHLWEGSVKADLGFYAAKDSRFDAANFLLTANYQQLMQNSRLGDFIESLGNRVAGKAVRYMKNVVRVPTTIRGKEQILNDFRIRNLNLIKDLGAEQIQKLNELVASAASAGVRHEELAPEVQKVLDVGQSRAELIARDQILKINGQMHQVAQTSAGIEDYVWSTSEDERVRDSHEALDGTRQSWADPPIVDGEAVHPGEAVQCRCVPVPVIPLLEDI